MVALPRQELDRLAAAPVVLLPGYQCEPGDPYADPELHAAMLAECNERAAATAALMAQEWGGPPRRSFAHGDRACSQCAGLGRIFEPAHYVRGDGPSFFRCDRCSGTGIA